MKTHTDVHQHIDKVEDQDEGIKSEDDEDYFAIKTKKHVWRCRKKFEDAKEAVNGGSQ